jgi:hypothetical protein
MWLKETPPVREGVDVEKELNWRSGYGACACVSAYLVAKTLRGNDGDFIADALVGLEVECELGVVALDDDFGGLLHGLATSIRSVKIVEAVD